MGLGDINLKKFSGKEAGFWVKAKPRRISFHWKNMWLAALLCKVRR